METELKTKAVPTVDSCRADLVARDAECDRRPSMRNSVVARIVVPALDLWFGAAGTGFALAFPGLIHQGGAS